jgi:hypothetical protein
LLERERLEAERLERLEAERLEAERLEAERLEAERLEAERLEAERLERLEALFDAFATPFDALETPFFDDFATFEERVDFFFELDFLTAKAYLQSAPHL